MQFQLTLPDGEYYRIQPQINNVTLLELTNDGPNTLYYGQVLQTVNVVGNITSGSPVVTLTDRAGSPLQGMDVSGTGLAANSRILSVHGNKMTLDKDATATADGVAISCDATFDDATGIPIEVGVTKSFTSSIYRDFLQRGFELYTLGTGGTVVRIFKMEN